MPDGKRLTLNTAAGCDRAPSGRRPHSNQQADTMHEPAGAMNTPKTAIEMNQDFCPERARD
jgi:hypothetical protein